MEAQPGKVDVIEYGDTSENGEFWFDYMADTGDGWNSTFRMAYLLARPQLVIQSHKLRRGSFLILGGDEVYPCASRQLYRERLVNPFWHACPRSLPPDPRDDQAHLYAIPGNHDWYDGLVSFMRQFLQGRNIGIWRTRQSRSYFALKLPHNWWIWGLDTQLESDINWPQVQFFIKAADRMGNQGNNLIVCTAEPYWIYANLYEEKESKRQLYNNLLFLMSEEVLGPKKVNLYLSLAGDLHHYRRHVDVCDQNRHRIVSGGGGAFLHPTHDCGLVERLRVREIARPGQEKPNSGGSEAVTGRKEASDTTGINVCGRTVPDKSGDHDLCPPTPKAPQDPQDPPGQSFEHVYRLAAQFPDEKTSRRLAFRNLLFFWNNPWFGVVPAAVYIVIGACMLDRYGYRLVFSPSLGALSVIFLAHLIVYGYLCDDRKGKWFRAFWGGLLHGGVQFTVGCLAVGVCYTAAQGYDWVTMWVILAVGIPFSGYLLGSTLLGVYLLISLNCWQVNQNEAFSALRIKDYKNFLRFCIKDDGSLEIFPVGVRRLGEEPILIEGPIRVQPSKIVEKNSTEPNSSLSGVDHDV